MKHVKSDALSNDSIMTRIHYIRSQKVILDKDLADMYDVTPKRLREQVKRNPERFPPHFMFQLTESEALEVPHFAAPSLKIFGGHMPYAFTEHGVLMAATILKSHTAVQVSLRLIEIFIQLREMLSQHKDILLRLEQLENKLTGHDQEIKLIFAALKELISQPPPPRRRIGYRRKEEND